MERVRAGQDPESSKILDVVQMKLIAFAVAVLRVGTVLWPLTTEVLAQLWWPAFEAKSKVPSMLVIGAYIALAFSPKRLLLSRFGVAG